MNTPSKLTTAKLTKTLKILAPLAVLAVSGTASAANVKFYPGTMCHGQGHNTLGYSEHGAAMNDSTSADMLAVCPVVRDEVRADGKGWGTLTITTLNTSPTTQLWCEARTYNTNDYNFAISQRRYQNVLTDWTDLTFTAVAAPNPGYVIIDCSIPKMPVGGYPGGIASFRIDE